MKLIPDQPELWHQFAACERNEMIITKSGRCLFPLLKFHLQLEPSDEGKLDDLEEQFSFLLGIVRVDGFKWKFRAGRWYPLPGREEKPRPLVQHFYEPRDTSPAPLSALLRPDTLSFGKVKLSNRRDPAVAGRDNYFYLSSFCHYRPLVILRSAKRTLRFEVNECSFIAVTHYQNDLITHLKKHNNPHAKGFLSPDAGLMIGRARPGRKRKLNPTVEVAVNDATHDAQAALDYDYDEADPDDSFTNHTDDVIQASLALEKMSRTPRYQGTSSGSNGHSLPLHAHSLPYQASPKYLTFNHRRQ